MSHHNQVQNLLSGYVLNELGAEQQRKVTDHLVQCAECRAEAEYMRSVLSIADTMATAQSSSGQQSAAVEGLHGQLKTARPVKPWWTSASFKAIAAILLIGILIALIFMAWHPAEDKTIADPQQDKVEQPLDIPIDKQVAHEDHPEQLDTELVRAKALFDAGNVNALAALFETSSDETKLAIVNYLNQLDTDQSFEALRSLDLTDSRQDVIDVVNRAVGEKPASQKGMPDQDVATDPNDADDLQSDPNTPEPAVILAAESNAETEADENEDVDNDQEGFIGIKVVAAATGKPIEGASLRFRHYANGKKEQTLKADQFGRAIFELKTEKTSSLNIKINAKGFVSKFLDWRPDSKGITMPKHHLVEMNQSIPIGGFVKTKQGEPIEGVSVEINTEYANEKTEFDYVQETVKTDKDGRWYYHDFDPDPSRYYLNVKHPEYVSLERYSVTPPMEQLKKQTYVFLMQKGLTVSGHVTTPDGTPVKGATIYQGWSRYSDNPETQTDEQGFYQFENCQHGKLFLTIVATGYAQDMLSLNVSEDVADADFVMAEGNTLTVRAEDIEGNPIEGVEVTGRKWRQYTRSQQCESIRCEAETDAQGIAVLKDLPADEVRYDIYKSGYASYREYPMVASDQGVVLTMYPKGRLVGKVYDADNNELINEFKMTEGIEWQGQTKPTWQSHGIKQCHEGSYELFLDYHTEGFAVKIEAEGYYPYKSETFYNEGKDIPLDIYLTKGDRIVGIVYDPSGAPVGGAEVGMCPESRWLNIRDGRLDDSDSGTFVKTDSQGQFALPPISETYAVVVACDAGYAQVDEAEFLANHEIHLSQWGRIEGTVYTGRNPAVNQEISIQTNQSRHFERTFNINEQSRVYSDEKGYFVYDRVIPGTVVVHKMVPLNNRSKRYANRTELVIEPGQTETVHLGGGGRTVTGTFVSQASAKFDYQQNNFEITISKDSEPEALIDLSGLPEILIPEDYFTRTPEQMQAWQAEWLQTPEGQEFMQAAQKIANGSVPSVRVTNPVVIDDKGRFKIEDIPPGEYSVSGTFRDPGKEDTNEYYQSKIAQVEFDLVVPDTEEPEEFDQPIEIGQIPILDLPTLEPGQIAPAIDMVDLEGNSIRLDQFRGHYVLLDFNGTQYMGGYGDDVLTALRGVYSTYHQSGKLRIVSCLSAAGVGGYMETFKSVKRAFLYYLDQKEIDWIFGFENLNMGESSNLMERYRVKNQRGFVLIAPDGTFLECIDDSAQLKEVIKKYLPLETETVD